MKLTNSTLVAIYNARADRNLSCVLLQNIAADIREEINLVDISAKYNVSHVVVRSFEQRESGVLDLHTQV